jgi:spore protease
LAVEINEDIDKADSAYSGIKVYECTDGMTGIVITELTVTSAQGERLLGKEKGKYISIEAAEYGACDAEYDEALTGIISRYICDVIEPFTVNNKSLLVIGLGNRDITADSLGPRVADALFINRHIFDAKNNVYRVSALVPGVMAQTGMETAQIVKGIAATMKPGVVIVIDALAAKNIRHLNKTFQISDRGIKPGSGVGNHRNEITQSTVGVPVVSIGLPTVIEMNDMFVTIKDVDLVVKSSAQIIANAINDFVYESSF